LAPFFKSFKRVHQTVDVASPAQHRRLVPRKPPIPRPPRVDPQLLPVKVANLPSRDVASKRVCFIWPLSSREFTELPSRDVASKRSFCFWPLSSREFTGLPSRDVASERSCFIRPFSSREFTEPHAIANIRRKYKRIFFNSHAVTSRWLDQRSVFR